MRLFLVVLFSVILNNLFAARVIFLLTDAGGKPVENAVVMVSGQQQATGTDGRAAFELEGGEHSVNVAHIHYTYNNVIVVTDDALVPIALQEEVFRLGSAYVKADGMYARQRKSMLHTAEVDGAFLRESTGNTLMSKLDRIAGVTSIDIGQGFAKPVIRGLSSNRVAVAENGIKQQGQQWGADHGLEIDAYNVERVEIVKGPSSLAYGGDAMGGIILINPEKRMEDGWASSLVLNGKSNNKLFGGSAHVAYRKNNWFAKGRATMQNYGDYYVPADSFSYLGYNLPLYDKRLKNTAGREYNFAAAAGVEAGRLASTLSASRVYGKMGFFAGAHGIPSANSLIHDGNDRNIGLPYQSVEHIKFISNNKYELSHKQKFYFDVAYQRNHRQEHATPHQHGNRPLPATSLELDLLLQTTSVTLKWEQVYNRQLYLTTGINAELQNNTIDGYSFLLPSFNQQTAGIFLVSRFDVTEKLTLSSGVRFDYGHINIHPHTDDYLAEGFLRAPGVDKSFNTIIYSIGASYNLKRNLGFKANLGKSFRMPTANELASNGVHHGTFRYEIGDPGLRAETAYQADLSFRYRNNYFLFSLSGFISYFPNYIFLNPTGEYSITGPNGEPILLPDVGQIYRYTGAETMRWGGEAELHVYPFRWLTLSTVNEYVYATNTEHNYPIPFTPPFGMQNRMVFNIGNFTRGITANKLELGHRFAAQQNRVRNELTTPSYNLFEIMFRSQIRYAQQAKPVEVVVAVNNLFNTVYYNHISYYRPLGLPEIGRNVSLSVFIPLI